MTFLTLPRPVVSTENSTSSTLGANATFTGTAEDVLQFATISVTVLADQNSATNGLTLEQSTDNTNWDVILRETIILNTSKVFTVTVVARYFRVTYTNGSTIQTAFRLQTIFSPSRVNVAVIDDGTIQPQSPMVGLSMGDIAGIIHINKFGRNPDIDTATVPEDLWDAGGVWVAPTAARIHDLASTDVADTSAGTGAQSIEIQGLDDNWELQSETLSLSGLANVPTSNTYRRIFRMKVPLVGSGGTNAGDITATAQVDGTVTAQVTASMAQTLMAIYTIPANKTGYMTSYYSSLNSANPPADMIFSLGVKPDTDLSTSPWQTKHILGINLNGSGYIQHYFKPYMKITEKSDIRMQAVTVSDNNSDVSGCFDIILVDN